MAAYEQQPPTVGTLAEYSEAPFERRTEWAREGDVVRIEGPQEDHHMVTHPEYVEQVLFRETDAFVKMGGYDAVFGGGIVTEYGDQWQAQRRAMQPAFQPGRIASYCETIRDITTRVRGDLTPGETIDVRELMTDLTMEVMLETLFGGTNGGEETISRAAQRITEWFLETATAGDVPPEVQREFERGREELTALIDRMIERRDGDEDGGLLSMLIALGPDSDAGYTDDRIRDEMITMLFAAHETTALTLTYALYLLADAPAAQRRIHEEVREAADGVPGAESLDALQYTEQVIDEALRLYPPAHSLFRTATEPVEIGGYTIPEGDVVYLPQWVLHRDERWWDEPLAFRPERFGESDSDRPRFAFFPFGAGPRRCIGESFARAETKIVVGGLLDAFEFERETQQFEMYASLTAVPNRPIRLTPRLV